MDSQRIGALGWLYQRIAGILLLLIFGLHFFWYSQTLGAPSSTDDPILLLQDLLSRPFSKTAEGIFLVLIASHGYLGLRSIAFDFQPSQRLTRVLTIVLRGVSLGVVVLGFFFLYRL